MKENALITILTTLIILSAISAIFAGIMLINLKKKEDLKVRLKIKKDFLYSSYRIAVKIPFLRRYMSRIKKRIEILDLSDEWTINRKTMRFTYFSLGISLTVLFILLILSQNLYFALISVFTVYILHNQIIKMLVDRLDSRLLKQFENFLENVRHHYHEHGMIDEAIYDSISECDYEMSLHAEKMYETLTDTNIDDRVDQFYDTAPNKYMKTFIAMSYLVQRFGDKFLEGKSIYLTNLNYLKQEINMELLRREKLGYLFQSLSAIAIFPIFTLNFIRKWAVSNIPELYEYYDGVYGFIATTVLFILAVAAYQLIVRLQTNAEYSPLGSKLLSRLLKIWIIRHITDAVYEKKYSKSLKYEMLLNKTQARMTVREFILKQILYSVLAFLLSLLVFLNVHWIARHNILYSSPGLKLAGYNPFIDKETELKEIETDRKYINLFKNKKVTFQELAETIRLNENYGDKNQVVVTAKRILGKIEKYRSHNFKWWELVICIVLSVISHYIPYWMLLFSERILKISMEDEVKQFHTIIMMLMHIERISVEDILHWMEQFAEIFKPSIQKCLNSYEYGDRQALEQLIIDEPYPPFARIVENLISAADKITVEQAFDELRLEREYYQEKRKQDNEIMVNRKGILGKFIAFIPMGATILLYILIPFILLSIRQLISFSDEIDKLF
ncbi:hypothetical protein Cst_c13610 [Thermoclostridium stercorarium subsp. stercorarium DSM 8532]|uniref:Uncharacterized protein n=3 Tax=Thermoclostridium stercorarium TaxID=1510 RepID=L7VNK2_THES1|nr:hypothetical protein [Thermoclostridium stercorarium]AGC68352.1 hypothetical protein Cst_c13610 [Thermoclostridium stercorarium subsp. stercorarium DSM 8532]AGI39375.1 hypothetical protein Clst_1314 [Thermoclostridium stercorarium subsp. stercorarium DSM 8532]ANW98694.1 hypothetical protein CSTERTH_06450 [Thermoclostridium stercorarium subsp. thermolacticum DSM 2910]